jgi:DNA repair protein RecN (Recombination protein N)
MLNSLSIRNVVLIDQLDLDFRPGLTALTGETGAGKSILLDSLGLALGMRADAGLIRAAASQASVAARFTPPAAHPVHTLLAEQGVAPDEDGVVLRRVLGRDGRSRAFINDQPVGVGLLRLVGAELVEVQGQGDQAALAETATQTALLDAFAVPGVLRASVPAAWRIWQAAEAALQAARAAQEQDARDRDWLIHAVSELTRLGPQPGEEQDLAGERQRLQQGERRAEAVAAAIAELTPRERRAAGPAAALRAAARALQRLTLADHAEAGEAAPALVALERAEEALAEAESLLSRLASAIQPDPRQLERAEERLFALRAAARKHGVAVADLPALHSQLNDRLAALENGEAGLAARARDAAAARAAYTAAATQLSEARRAAAARLDREVSRELPPLKLDRARFVTELASLPEAGWGPAGMESVRFLIATNPGQPAAPLGRVASGGELSRLLLALKVVLAQDSSAGTLVFDEVDSGVGGATAAAVGERLARVAQHVQVLVVTHSPQVAARAAAHLRVAKQAGRHRTATLVQSLDPTARREEIARMLAGSSITEAARAAADSLLGSAA